jgi:hypothetical protein
MRRLPLVASLIFTVIGCGLFDRNVVARAGDHELTVAWFAETLVEGDVPLRPAVVERWAWMWIQYSLFLQRLADGDSLLDTNTVREAMWPEVMTGTVELLLERLAQQQVTVDSAVVDSAYEAGEHRIIDHILVRGDAAFTPEERAVRLRRAQSIRTRLAAGRLWRLEARTSDDLVTRADNGRLGLVTRGRLAPAFEEVAFSLQPGELSEVVESPAGFHVMRRPPLEEVYDQFLEGVREVLESRWRLDFAARLAERRNVRVTEDGPAIIRDAADRPIQILVREPGRLVGSYDGGVLTDVDYVAWMQALPARDHMGIKAVGDEEIEELARSAMRWEVLFLEAKRVGTELTDSMYTAIKQELGARIMRVRNAMRVDSALANAEPTERRDATRRVLEDYLIHVLTTDRDITVVAPFLARKLRSESRWNLSYGGLERTIALAERLKAARDAGASGGGWSGTK